MTDQAFTKAMEKKAQEYSDNHGDCHSKSCPNYSFKKGTQAADAYRAEEIAVLKKMAFQWQNVAMEMRSQRNFIQRSYNRSS